MIWKKKDKKKDAEKELDKEIQSIIDMDDDEFLLSEEIDGYTSCAGLNAQRYILIAKRREDYRDCLSYFKWLYIT